jgi:peroxiredoxin
VRYRSLPLGTRAPNFTLPDLAGTPRSLTELCEGKRLLLVFSDPDCRPCQELVPKLVQLQHQHCANNLEVVIISRGGVEANAAKVEAHNITFPLLLQQRWEISKKYGVVAIPAGYLIDERGIVAKDVAIGSEAILRLMYPQQDRTLLA